MWTRLVWLTACVASLGPVTADPLALQPPACALAGVTLAPAGPLCAWLGIELTEVTSRALTGRVAAGRAGTFTVTVGRPTARVLGNQVALARVPVQTAGDIYVPVRFLADLTGAELAWDGATRRVSLRHAGREAEFHVPPEVYPALSAEYRILLGGWAGGAWRRDVEVAQQMAGAETYRLLRLTGPAGSATGAAPRTEQPGEFQYVELTGTGLNDETDAGLIGLAAPWEPQPRLPQATALTQPTYLEAARAILAEHGLGKIKPTLRQVLRIDLEGDGVEEVLFSATCARDHYPRHFIEFGDYSFVALRRVVAGRVTTQLLEGVFYTRPAEFAAPLKYEVAACADLNGDDRLEILIDWSYYEGSGTSVYELREPRATLVLDGGAGA